MTKKYKYLGSDTPTVIDNKEIYLQNGQTYDLNPDLKYIKTLLNLGYLKEVEKVTIPVKSNSNNDKNGKKGE